MIDHGKRALVLREARVKNTFWENSDDDLKYCLLKKLTIEKKQFNSCEINSYRGSTNKKY